MVFGYFFLYNYFVRLRIFHQSFPLSHSSRFSAIFFYCCCCSCVLATPPYGFHSSFCHIVCELFFFALFKRFEQSDDKRAFLWFEKVNFFLKCGTNKCQIELRIRSRAQNSTFVLQIQHCKGSETKWLGKEISSKGNTASNQPALEQADWSLIATEKRFWTGVQL